jgi:hypothetical protein
MEGETIQWPKDTKSLYCLIFHLRLLITPLLSVGHCIVSPSIYSYWLQLWYLLVIILSLLPFTSSDYMEGETIQWPIDTKSVIRSCKWKERQYNDQKITKVIRRLLLWYLLVIVLSLLPFTASNYTFGIFWSLYCLSFHLQLLITPLVSFGHYIVSSSIYVFWLPLCYLLFIKVVIRSCKWKERQYNDQ